MSLRASLLVLAPVAFFAVACDGGTTLSPCEQACTDALDIAYDACDILTEGVEECKAQADTSLSACKTACN